VSALSPSGPTSTPFRRARAREGGFAALALLVERGPTESLRSLALASPPMKVALAAYERPEQAEADHQRGLGREAFPYAGAMLDPQGRAGATDEIAVLYESIGFRWSDSGVGADHLATQLRAMAFLLGAETEASEDRQHGAWGRVREAQRAVLDQSLLRWLPVWAVGQQRTGLAWPRSLSEQVLNLCLLVRSELQRAADQPWVLPPPPDLDDRETDLTAIAALIARPALGGVLFTRSELRRAARDAGAPAGFGPRPQIVLNALRSAATFGTLPALLEGLQRIAAEQTAQLLKLQSENIAGVDAAVRPWLRRAAWTQDQLARVAAAAQVGA